MDNVNVKIKFPDLANISSNMEMWTANRLKAIEVKMMMGEKLSMEEREFVLFVAAADDVKEK